MISATFLDSLHADPWAEQFADLPSLNAAASDAIEASIGKMRAVARAEPQSLRSSSLVVLGPPGAGKTHLFSRLRSRLGPKAVFVHLRPLVHMEITPRFVLGEVVKQLGYVTHGGSGLPQAHALVGSLLAKNGWMPPWNECSRSGKRPMKAICAGCFRCPSPRPRPCSARCSPGCQGGTAT